MKKLLNEELRQISNIVSSMPKTIKESMDYDVPQDEPIDTASFDAASEEEIPVAPEEPQQPAQETNFLRGFSNYVKNLMRLKRVLK